ncbi:hypothetical protein B0H14DRAFT_2850598 [Mycena olivaceomarginata]|nr:hypothetical protein B0H14DRAFT_2850598 [Mycena olivaceomarginata]
MTQWSISAQAAEPIHSSNVGQTDIDTYWEQAGFQACGNINSSNYSSNYEEVDSPQTQNRHASSSFAHVPPSDSALVLASGTTAGHYVDQGRCLTDEERQIAARTLWQEVPQSNEDRFFRDFVLRVIGNSDSAICEYREHGRTIYFAAAGKGSALRLGQVVLPRPAPFQAVAVVFFTHSHDPVLTQALWGHGRFIKSGSSRSTDRMESRFQTVPITSDGISFDLVTAVDDTLWLPSHHQLELTLDYNVPTKNIVDLFTGWMDVAMQNLVIEYVYAVLAVLYKLRTDEQKINYLEYQRQYLTAGIATCLKTGEPLYDVYQRALNQIGKLLKVISDSSRRRNLHPTADQESEARGFGLIMSLWTMEAYRRAVDSVHVDVVWLLRSSKPTSSSLERGDLSRLDPQLHGA